MLSLPNRDTSITDKLGSATRAEQAYVQRVKFLSKLDQPGLVIDGENGYQKSIQVFPEPCNEYQPIFCDMACQRVVGESETKVGRYWFSTAPDSF